jgi:hypothetical protein
MFLECPQEATSRLLILGPDSSRNMSLERKRDLPKQVPSFMLPAEMPEV